MKLKQLKEAGRDLPGFGDEATWGGRTPYPDDDEQVNPLDGFVTVDSDELDGTFIVDPGLYSSDDPKIEKDLAEAGFKITNDTGHSFTAAFAYAQKHVENFFIHDNDSKYVSVNVIPALKQQAAAAGKEFTLTQLVQLNKRWMQTLLSEQPEV